MSDIFKKIKTKYNLDKPQVMSLNDYIKLLETDSSVRRTPFERMLSAIGEPEIVDTSLNTRLSKLFGNRLIKRYKPFEEFYGLEDVIERIVSYFKFAAQGLEESRQILYLLGPVGGGKSSLAEKLKQLMAQEPIYVLADNSGQMSPIFETPLGLLSAEDFPEIPSRYFKYQLSPWAMKRLEEYEGDISKFKVVKTHPNESKQIALSKTEPGDDNCLLGDHEFLTPTGWKQIKDYQEGDLVGQYTEEGNLEFVLPTDYITGTSKEIIHFKNRNLDISVTPSHRMIYQTRGRSGAPVLIKYHNAKEGNFSSAFVIQTAKGGQEGIPLTDEELRLQVAIAADGSFRKDNKTNYCVMTLQKERKRLRLESLLLNLGIDFKTSVPREGHIAYTFYAPMRNKNLANYWEASHEQLVVISDEIVHWDGHQKVRDRGAFFTTKKDEADFVQYALMATGRRASISIRKAQKESHKDLYIVNINKNNTRVNYGELTPETELGEFPVYCFNVPSTMFITRRNGIISVTGNNQDISALVGKTNIRKLEHFDQNDPDSYSYSGGLNKSNQGLLEFVEMFKAPIKILHPLLTATQEGDYNATEGLPSLPFEGVILAHSNNSEWAAFKNDSKNEAFIDRVYIVKVPYCLKVKEEVEIYKKLIRNSDLADKPLAPSTLELLAKMMILTRIDEPENSPIWSKLRVYNGEDIKETDPKAKSLNDYRSMSSKLEGFEGLSTRLAYKILSEVYNYDTTEIAANPVHLFNVLEKVIYNEHLNENTEERYMGYLNDYIKIPYVDEIGKEIQECYLDSYSEYGQNLFDRYITYADYWLQDQDYRDPDTGQLLDKAMLTEELEKIEVPAEISNKKDFRNEVVNFCLHYRADHGHYPEWTSYSKLKNVIEKSMFNKTEDLLPVISFHGHKNKDSANKHKDFIARMVKKGYTEKQIKLLCEWYVRSRKAQ